MKSGFGLAESAQIEIRGAKGIQQRGILPVCGSSRSQNFHDIRGTARLGKRGCVVEPGWKKLWLPSYRLLVPTERLVKLPGPRIGVGQLEVEFRLLRLVNLNAPFQTGNAGSQVGPVSNLRNVEIERCLPIRRQLS